MKCKRYSVFRIELISCFSKNKIDIIPLIKTNSDKIAKNNKKVNCLELNLKFNLK